MNKPQCFDSLCKLAICLIKQHLWNWLVITWTEMIDFFYEIWCYKRWEHIRSAYIYASHQHNTQQRSQKYFSYYCYVTFCHRNVILQTKSYGSSKYMNKPTLASQQKQNFSECEYGELWVKNMHKVILKLQLNIQNYTKRYPSFIFSVTLSMEWFLIFCK